MKVLIIKTSSLGDIIHALPVLDYLRQVVPEASIDWVVEEPFACLVEHNPLLSKVHRIRTKAWRKALFSAQTWHEVGALRRALRAVPYDLVFDLQGNLKSGLIAWLTGAKKRIGFSLEALQEKINVLFTSRKVWFRLQDNRASLRYLRIVSEPFDRDYADFKIATMLVASPEDKAVVDTYLSGLPPGPKFLLQVGTTWDTKLWYSDGWVELAKRILEWWPGATLLINWGSPVEKTLGERIAVEVSSAVRLLPWFKIKELIPLIQQMDLVIGGDTGPIYIAGAVGVPTVSLYRATRAELYAPVGPCHRSVQAVMSCTGCLKSRCERDEECRHSISVDMVADAVQAVMNQERC